MFWVSSEAQYLLSNTHVFACETDTVRVIVYLHLHKDHKIQATDSEKKKLLYFQSYRTFFSKKNFEICVCENFSECKIRNPH